MMILNRKNPLVCMICIKVFQRFNPLGPNDALKHHFTSLKTDLTFLKQRVLERKFP